MSTELRTGPRKVQPPAHEGTPDPVLAGDRLLYDGMTCHVGGIGGPPMLLLHDLHLTASVAELRPLYERLRDRHTVFAPDLPGFGLSKRPLLPLTPRRMADAVHATLAQIDRHCGAGSVDALAVGQSCEILARAAVEAPFHFAKLAFVSPTGLEGRGRFLRQCVGTQGHPVWLALLTSPRWGPWLYRRLTQPARLRRWMERRWGGASIDESLFGQALASASSPGAWRAPMQVLAGCLSGADALAMYERVSSPVWVSYGVCGRRTDYRALTRLPALAAWRRTAFYTGDLPYFEQPDAFVACLESYLDQPPIPVSLHACAEA